MQGDCARCLAVLHRAGPLGVFVHGRAVAAGLVDPPPMVVPVLMKELHSY